MKKKINIQIGVLLMNSLTESLFYVKEIDGIYVQVQYLNNNLDNMKEWIVLETLKELIDSKQLVYYPIRN